MDKKQAEEDAVRKAKETTHAAGKNTGMSGRDLVRLVFYFSDLFTPVSVVALDRESNLYLDLSHSLRSTPNGSRRKKRRKRIGIWTSIGNRRKRRTRLQRRNEFGSFRYRRVVQNEPGFVLFRLVLRLPGSSLAASAPGKDSLVHSYRPLVVRCVV